MLPRRSEIRGEDRPSTGFLSLTEFVKLKNPMLGRRPVICSTCTSTVAPPSASSDTIGTTTPLTRAANFGKNLFDVPVAWGKSRRCGGHALGQLRQRDPGFSERLQPLFRAPGGDPLSFENEKALLAQHHAHLLEQCRKDGFSGTCPRFDHCRTGNDRNADMCPWHPTRGTEVHELVKKHLRSEGQLMRKHKREPRDLPSFVRAALLEKAAARKAPSKNVDLIEVDGLELLLRASLRRMSDDFEQPLDWKLQLVDLETADVEEDPATFFVKIRERVTVILTRSSYENKIGISWRGHIYGASVLTKGPPAEEPQQEKLQRNLETFLRSQAHFARSSSVVLTRKAHSKYEIAIVCPSDDGLPAAGIMNFLVDLAEEQGAPEQVQLFLNARQHRVTAHHCICPLHLFSRPQAQ